MAEPEGPQEPTLADQLKTAREKLEADLRRIKRAEQILKEKPEVEELLEAVSRIRKHDEVLLHAASAGII